MRMYRNMKFNSRTSISPHWRCCLKAAPLFTLSILGGCGPSEKEIGIMVALSAPAIIVTCMIVSKLLCFLWRKLQCDIHAQLWPSLTWCALTFFIAISAYTQIRSQQDGYGMFKSGCLGAGPSVIAIWLLMWRVWMLANRSHAFTWALPVASSIFFLPAWYLVLCGSDVGPASDYWINFFVFPGYLGFSAIPLLVVLLAEATYRTIRHNKDCSR